MTNLNWFELLWLQTLTNCWIKCTGLYITFALSEIQQTQASATFTWEKNFCWAGLACKSEMADTNVPTPHTLVIFLNDIFFQVKILVFQIAIMCCLVLWLHILSRTCVLTDQLVYSSSWTQAYVVAVEFTKEHGWVWL